jgi:hypothetical protein
MNSRLMLCVAAFICLLRSNAQPIILSTVPATGATGVSPQTTVVFTFSTAMNPEATDALFFGPAFNLVPTTPSWNPANTVLTCTPVTSFPANATITWFVSGEDMAGNSLDGFPTGSFSTATGGGGGVGTNAITTFSIGKIHHYNQTAAGPPTLDPSTPYDFSAVTALASNRTATNINLTFPTAAVSNLTQLPPPSADKYVLYGISTSFNDYEATYTPGTYRFRVGSVSSNQTVDVILPTTNSMPQPGAPHLTNFLAAQAVNPNQPFVLAWDPFPGGTAADYIDVDIGSAYLSPEPGTPGALPGTAVTFTIPAGTLQPNTTYPSRVGFFRHVGSTNSSYATAAYRATYTEFSLVTTAAAGDGQLILTNVVHTPPNFTFDVLCPTGQTVTVEYKTNLNLVTWQTLLITNSRTERFQAVAPQASTNRSMFFRARVGL